MARKNGAEKVVRWGEILKRQADSGLSVRKFCATEGIGEPSFYAWRKKLRPRGNDDSRLRKSKRRTAAPECLPDSSDDGGLFVPVKLLDSNHVLEIIHPLGYRIQVTGDLNPIALRHVIEVLDERGGR
jgi:hypothetical protein